jgi:Gpi18-like mannosyltransferase
LIGGGLPPVILSIMPNVRKPPPYAEWLLVAGLAALAVLARRAGWWIKTNDTTIFFEWVQQMRAAGVWHGIGRPIGNYNAPFLYLLTIVIYLPGPFLLKIKAIFVVFDLVLASFTYKIVALRFDGRRIPAAAALAMLLLPTVVINASWYGQMDAMWASFALGGVYFLMRDRPWVAVSLCAASLAIKPQGIFIFPLLLLLALGGRLPWRTLLAVPAVFLLLDIPALLAGRSPMDLLTVYDMDRQAAHVPALTSRAPSLYAFIPAGPRADTVRVLGYIFTAALILAILYVLIIRNVQITRDRLVTYAALFAIAMPFLLPGMHERYFFLADVTTVLLAIHKPRFWPVPLVVQAASLLCYEPYLFGGRSPEMLPLTVPATLMLAALVTVIQHVLKDAFAFEVTGHLDSPEVPDTPAELEELSRPAGDRPAPLPARRA